VIPAFVPMQPTLVREPFHRSGWVYEEKYDWWCWPSRIAHASGSSRRQCADDTERSASSLPAPSGVP